MREIESVFLSNRMTAIQREVEALAAGDRDTLAAGLLDAIADASTPLMARISAGNTLGLLGDPRIGAEPEMCPVPGGPFAMGTPEDEAEEIARRYAIPEAWMLKSTPRHQLVLDSFELARFQVTEAEYASFVRDTGVEEIPAHWVGNAPPPYRSNHPVHGVSWQGVLLFVEWSSEHSGRQYRIPTEAEWEKAARGHDGRAFPWGERFEAGRCNTREGGVAGTTPVGIYPDGASPCGALDLAGNVEEYTADLYAPYPGSRFRDPEYGSYRMTRGGVFSLDADLARCDRRHGERYAGPTGFRLAHSAADDWLGRNAP